MTTEPPPASPPVSSPSYVVGIDTAVTDLREADHLLRSLAAELALPEGTFGCTHLVRGDRPRIALSLTVASEPVLAAARAKLAGRGYALSDTARTPPAAPSSTPAPRRSPAR